MVRPRAAYSRTFLRSGGVQGGRPVFVLTMLGFWTGPKDFHQDSRRENASVLELDEGRTRAQRSMVARVPIRAPPPLPLFATKLRHDLTEQFRHTGR